MNDCVGVDLGGTKVAAARLRDGELGEAVLHETDRSGSNALIEQLASIVHAFRGERPAAVGIGVPSIVDFESGRVISSVNVPLADVPLREELERRVGAPVFVDNDANAAALAEAHDERLRMVARHLVMITVGTGIGGGLVLGGRIYRGATGGAGELGHTMIGADLTAITPAPTSFPQPGSLEWEAAGHALDRMVIAWGSSHPDSVLGKAVVKVGDSLGADAVEAANSGDEDAVRIITSWGERLGIGIANAINTLDPEEVVIGGGAARAGELLLEPARQVAWGYVVPGLGRRTTIRAARHGVRAGVLGAALLAAYELGDSRPDAPGRSVSPGAGAAP
jgi:glucokinase